MEKLCERESMKPYCAYAMSVLRVFCFLFFGEQLWMLLLAEKLHE